jgi:hypothetical protein
MTKSATDVMQEIIYSAVVDALFALKTGSKGVPNALLRDINAVHPNTTFADLPKELQDAIGASVRGAFTRLLKEGYSVGPAGASARPAPAPRRDGPPGDRRPRPPGGGRDRPSGGRDRPGGGRDRPGGGRDRPAGSRDGTAKPPQKGPRGPNPRKPGGPS